MGVTEGGTRAQIVTGQTGGTSIELSQSGCISPSMQRQTQEAQDSPVSNSTKAAASNRRIAPSLLGPRSAGLNRLASPALACQRNERRQVFRRSVSDGGL
jgi:hypothetical protein